LPRHFRIAAGDFVKDDLRGKEIVSPAASKHPRGARRTLGTGPCELTKR
jgi:hypothetical protein